MPRLEAASISMTSTVPPEVISLQLAHSPHGVAVGPWMQFRQRARMRATVVFPVPRWPEKMYPWAMRFCAIAFSSVVLTCSWLTTSWNVWGRYLRAITWYMGWAYARPRVIRGTRTAPLPLLPSGPGGVCGRPLHGARDLTSIYRSTRAGENRVQSRDRQGALESGRPSV